MSYRSPAEQATLDRLLAADVGTGRLVAYGDHPDQIVEWWGEEGPVVALVHGGYFRAAVDRTHARPMAAAIAQRGYRVALVEYRRIAGEPDASLTDLRILAERLHREGLAVGAWIGHSAGGTLVLLLALKGLGTPALALAPVVDLARNAEAGLGDDAVTEWMDGLPGEIDGYHRVDPAQILSEKGSPDLTTLGIRLLVPMDDTTVPPEHCSDLGLPFVAVPGAHHFDVVDPESEHFGTTLALIREHVTPGTA
ncbi:hypothetical protein AADG42_17645 [Ammonicoccus fulvus]|uniref:Alpha/beta hydrolase n=1 Tax=Ammonicoccus fulvus TaxID=3138240 RepID=A0ABZ3FSI9_9ACTN